MPVPGNRIQQDRLLLAKYCPSAAAEADGIRLIAAVMAAPDYKARFADAQALLNYGYASCRLLWIRNAGFLL